ncbi:unnamed protein product [Pylaiella littoralis]
METPEKKSEFAKRVLFGASKASGAAATAAGNATASERPAGSTRSGSQSSTSSAPGPSIYSLPGTPRTTTGGPGAATPYMLRTPGKPATSNNAALSVFLRVRPPGAPGADLDKLTGRRTYQILEDRATLRTFPPLSAGHSRTINRQAKDFGFTRVFSPTAGQAETYESTMRPLVDDVFAAQNALLFAYGMTNAGKTYTVLGEDGSPGLIPQALTDTFERVAETAEADVRVEMSFLEIYIENVYDLLAAAEPDEWAKARTALKLDDRMGVIQARDLSKHVITSAADGLELVRRATANRRVASTKLNEDSSRSHSVCMIKLIREKGKDSSLWVVDLAGSERSGRTGAGASSTRQKEANNINKSLSTLWHCLTIMRANLRKDEPETRVPFRESKLTHLFKNHLQGPAAGKTVMVVNINPSTVDFDETQQVLKNSTIAREVKTVKDDSAANRQNGLIHTPYGFNGRKMVVKKPQASRRSIHQAVAPKLEGLDPPPPRQSNVKSPKRVVPSHGDTDCGSDAGDADGEGGGYLSGAESDSGLVDTRQSMNLVVRNLQVDNAALKTKLQVTLANKQKKDAERGHQPVSGGPLEQYIVILEDRVALAEARMEEMRQDHRAEVQDLENEFESFVAENGLDGESGDGPQASPAVMKRLQEEVRVANLQADQWKKEAETLRSRLQKEPGGSTRSPLRQSIGSTSQGRTSLENRQENGENSPPGPPPGGVGSPSKKSPRNSTSSPKTKASALPNKKKKKAFQSVTPVAQESATATATTVTATVTATATSESPMHAANAVSSSSNNSSSKSMNGGSSKDIGAGVAEGGTRAAAAVAAATARESKESGGCWGNKKKVVVAVSRRVSVLRVSTAGSRRVSAVRASLANSRRASRASNAAAAGGGGGGRRVSHLTRSRTSAANANNNNVNGCAGGGGSGSGSPDGDEESGGGAMTSFPLMEGEDDEERYSYAGNGEGGLGSRRESAMSMEENFFDKARRCMLRAIGVGRKSSSRAGLTSHSGSSGAPAVAETAEEIELRHKIKVKMPKRPSKKAMEAVFDELWAVENQTPDATDEAEVIEEVEEGEEEPSPSRASSSAVMSGIERWVFGGKQEQRATPMKSPTRSKAGGSSATAEVSPIPGTTTIHDYVRAM